MSLTVTESITTREGAELQSHYIRLEPSVPLSGTEVTVEWYNYASKELYKSGASTITTNEKKSFDYDASVDGSDIVSVAHTKLKDYLTTSTGTLYDEEGNGTQIPPRYNSENVTITDLD